MQLPVLGCTFLTLSEQQGSAPIISALMIGAQQCHLPLPRSAIYLCPAVHPPVPSTCAHQCHPPVPVSAAQQCCQSVPCGCASQCPAVAPVSAQQ
ncbi:unnamed protein product [Staurois parvus]|uniref:Uncharacterized protein n=1 Tax=Staurois parvus TaxID=386267 RepID=A0ABN9DHF4_9NEOB|nr:unnamed protein product [Staurois parvus]